MEIKKIKMKDFASQRYAGEVSQECIRQRGIRCRFIADADLYPVGVAFICSIFVIADY